MEALRTQLDNLLWEVNRLDAENQQLRASDEEVGLRVNREAEVEQTKQDAEVSTTELETCKRRIKEVKQDVIDAELRASEAEQSSSRKEQEAITLLKAMTEWLNEAEGKL